MCRRRKTWVCITSQLRDWVKKLADDPQHAFPGQGQMKPEQLEIARLKREVTKLKAERDILKKAAAYFAKEFDVKFGFIAKHTAHVQPIGLSASRWNWNGKADWADGSLLEVVKGHPEGFDAPEGTPHQAGLCTDYVCSEIFEMAKGSITHAIVGVGCFLVSWREGCCGSV